MLRALDQSVRSVASLVLPRTRAVFHERRAAEVERPHLEEFQDFYKKLENKQDIFYVLFSSGLLHWVSRTVALVPDHVNLVLMGSHLEPEEAAWIRANLKRPFHHVRLWIDDKSAWEFLFKTNEYHFGWMDADCFVLEPGLFDEMARIDEDTSINCTWSFDLPDGTSVLLTYFLFVNVDVIRAVNEKLPVSPATYTYRVMRQPGLPQPYAMCKVPSRQHVELLKQVLPSRWGRPVFPSESQFFDTLQVYQLTAKALGYRLNKVRAFGPLGGISDELVHVGKISYFRILRDLRVRRRPAFKKLYDLLVQINYIMLGESEGHLPERYTEMTRELREELVSLGLPTDMEETKAMVTKSLQKTYDERNISRIFGLGGYAA